MPIKINFINLRDNNVVLGDTLDVGLEKNISIDLEFEITEPGEYAGFIYKNSSKIGEFGKTNAKGEYLEWYGNKGTPIYVNGGDIIKAELEHVINSAPQINWNGWEAVSVANPDYGTNYYHAIIIKNRIYRLTGINQDATGAPAQTNFYYMEILPNGDLTGVWVEDPHPQYTSLFTPQPITIQKRLYYGTLLYNDYLYIRGGRTGDNAKLTHVAKINPDGSIGTFVETASESELPLNETILLRYESYMYSISLDYNNVKDMVEVSNIASDGKLSNWVLTEQPLQKSTTCSAFIVGNRIFISGGTAGNIIQYSKINSDGSLEPWQISNTSLPKALLGSTPIVEGNVVYLVGGVPNNTANVVKDVVEVKIAIGAEDPVISVETISSNNEPYTSTTILKGPNKAYIVGGSKTGYSSWDKQVYVTDLLEE